VDYFLHEGCNAQVWVQFRVEGALILPKGTQLLTRTPAQSGVALPPGNTTSYRQALDQGALVFETIELASFAPQYNEMRLHSQDVPETLPQGATRAILSGAYPHLNPGAVLIFEEVLGPASGRPQGADPTHRHAVRLCRVTPTLFVPVHDPQHPNTPPIPKPSATAIEWYPEDALPFPLWITSLVNGVEVHNVSVARGNVVLADHGRSLSSQTLEPATVPFTAAYRQGFRTAI
jgi:hypothetical protein